ncbi:MAG: pyrrolo-quinoline quinone [Planctomycetota bacterium]|nr:MAG: pyrrolo-quinoline quinone [Planctomycetota bacterium]
MMRTRWLACLGLLGLLCTFSPSGLWAQEAEPQAQGTDWTNWRGPQRNGVSTETNLPDTWDPQAEPGAEGSNLVWKRDDLGSRSTPIVMRDKLYMICNAERDVPEREGEKVVCLDAATGETLWEYRFNVYLSDVPRERVGWSCVVGAPHQNPEDDLVFAQGVCGYFCCLNANTGEVKWDKSLHEQYGALSTYGGRTNFPLVHEANVICSAIVIGWGEMAKPAHRFIAFDYRSHDPADSSKGGLPVWFNGTRLLPEDTTYSAPILATFNGQLAMVFGSGDGAVHAMEPRTGRLIWSYYVSSHGLNCTPLVVGNRVYCGHSEENLDANTMGAFFCIDATQQGEIAEPVWKIDEMAVSRSTPLHIDGRLYVIEDGAKLAVLDAETGEEIARKPLGTMQRSSPLYADGKIYNCTAGGRWYIMKPSEEEGVEILERGRLAGGEECHGSIIAAQGRIYFPSTDAMYCFAKPDASPQADPVPQLLVELPKADNPEPAQVQIAPVEVLLRPGTAQQFDIRLYNELGQFVGVADVEEATLTIDGPGSVAIEKLSDGTDRWTYSIPDDFAEHAAVIVTATVGELTGEARIRVVPELGWAFDFDDGEVPETWVGCSYRHIVIDYDLFSRLTEQDPMAGQLYIYLRTGLVNFNRTEQVYDNSTPAQGWTDFLRYLQLDQGEAKPKNLEEAQAKLDPVLEILKSENVIASYEWSTWDRPTGVEGVTEQDVRLAITLADRPFEGNGVMCKITTIPKGMRSQGWMGHDDLHDYTVQADVYGLRKNGKLPDIGLVAQRYTMDLMGASQQLQFRTWTTQLDRFSVDVPFEWQEKTWYTMKFQASVEDGKAVLRGKVWQRDEEEPADWMIVGEDEVPNVKGSPGVFGNAKDAELFYDNLTVTSNAAPAETAAAE